MSKIEQFLNDVFGEVRVLKDGVHLYFVAQDVAKALEYRMASDMTRNLDSDEIHTQSLRTDAGKREFTLVNESGLYSAVLSITKRNKERYEKAKEFKKWITGEVIPTIRETGGYVEDDREQEFIDVYFNDMPDNVKADMMKSMMKTNKELKVKSGKFDIFLDDSRTHTFTEVSKMISTRASEELGEEVKISGIKMTKHLRESGVLSKNRSGKSFTNLPNKDYEDYFDVISRSVGEDITKTQTRVKGNGIDFIYELLLEDGIFTH